MRIGLAKGLWVGWLCTRGLIIFVGYLAIAVLLLAALVFLVLDPYQAFDWAVAVSPDRTQTAIGVDYHSGGAISPSFVGEVRMAGGVVRREEAGLGDKGTTLLFGGGGIGTYSMAWDGPGRLSVERSVQ